MVEIGRLDQIVLYTHQLTIHFLNIIFFYKSFYIFYFLYMFYFFFLSSFILTTIHVSAP